MANTESANMRTIEAGDQLVFQKFKEQLRGRDFWLPWEIGLGASTGRGCNNLPSTMLENLNIRELKSDLQRCFWEWKWEKKSRVRLPLYWGNQLLKPPARSGFEAWTVRGTTDRMIEGIIVWKEKKSPRCSKHKDDLSSSHELHVWNSVICLSTAHSLSWSKRNYDGICNKDVLLYHEDFYTERIYVCKCNWFWFTSNQERKNLLMLNHSLMQSI